MKQETLIKLNEQRYLPSLPRPVRGGVLPVAISLVLSSIPIVHNLSGPSQATAQQRTPLSDSFCRPSILFAGEQPVTTSIHDDRYPLRGIFFGLTPPDRVRTWPLPPTQSKHQYSRALLPGSVSLTGDGTERLAYFTATTCSASIPNNYPRGLKPSREYRVRRTYCNALLPPATINVRCNGYFNPYTAFHNFGNQQIRKKTCLPRSSPTSFLTGIQISAALTGLPGEPILDPSALRQGTRLIYVHFQPGRINRDDSSNCIVRR